MHGDGEQIRPLWVFEDMMTSSDPVRFISNLTECSDDLLSCEARELTHQLLSIALQNLPVAPCDRVSTATYRPALDSTHTLPETLREYS